VRGVIFSNRAPQPSKGRSYPRGLRFTVIRATIAGMNLMTNESSAAHFVAATPWCRALDDQQRERLRVEIRERVVPKGALICRHGDRVEFWKGVVHGLVKISVASPEGRTSTFTGLAPGAWFGEGPVLRSDTWDFDGVAMRETRLALIPRATFEWLLDVSPAFNRFLIIQLNERLAQSLSIVEAERLEGPDTRVARCLHWLFNPLLYPNAGSRLALSQEEIGYLSGVSRQRVNKALRLLEEARLLRVEYGGVEVLDLIGLGQFRA